MSACDALVRDASLGVAASLRAVDCVSAEATSSAFARLFGSQGVLLPVLTALLTLYVGVFALLLLTGRARLSIGAMTPRMITLGLVLTFTTSSVAYQAVVWNLAVGAPDQIAGLLLGADGSATQLFAGRIDILFNAIAESAAAPAPVAPAPGAFSAANLMWLGALLLMLGTVGVLLTARIALAVLLGLGPVFICMALFNGTRGLFAGWLKAVLLTALTPLLAILGGALMTELAAPIVAGLRDLEGVNGRAAMALFVLAAVHCALMALALRVASTLVGGWQVFGSAGAAEPTGRTDVLTTAPTERTSAAGEAPTTSRARALGLSLSPGAAGAPEAPASAPPAPAPRRISLTTVTPPAAGVRPSARSRARGIGSRFSAPSANPRKRLV